MSALMRAADERHKVRRRARGQKRKAQGGQRFCFGFHAAPTHERLYDLTVNPNNNALLGVQEACELLLEAGCPWNLQDKDGYCAGTAGSKKCSSQNIQRKVQRGATGSRL